MERKIKLIWDFRGSDAAPIAAHHAKHLQEYAKAKHLDTWGIGHQSLTPQHSIAFLVVIEDQMIAVRDALKPHRGELYQQTPD